MSTAKDERLTDSAGRVADGRAVDWTREASDDPAIAHELESLSRIERIASAWRTLGDFHPDDDAEPARAVAFRWGELEAIEKLGEGSFGEVWRAWDPRLERDVALKLRHATDTDASVRRDLDEARLLARVRHPNVLTVYDVAVHDGRAGLVTDFVRGATLESRLASGERWSPDEAALVGLDLCRALAAVHATGLVHGDVKAANVMREDGGRLVLMDFGSAHAAAIGAGPGRTGTPLAAAPELLRGERATPASDLYSLGVLLFRLTSGRWPVPASSLEELRAKHARGERESLRALRPEASSAFVQAIDRALDPDPSKRPRDAGVFESELARALADRGAPAAEAAPRSTRRRVAWVPALAAAAAVVVIAAFALTRPRGPARETTVAVPPPAASGPREVSPAPTSATGAPTAAAPAPATAPAVAAALFRAREGGREEVESGATLSPGDRLSLEVSADEPVYVYVLDEDDRGETYTLFPVAGADAGNPLSAASRHVLPGRRAGVPFDWVVTSAGGREHVLVVASRKPVAALERAVAAMAPASEERPVAYAPVSEESWVGLRGIGGLAAAPERERDESRLQALARDLRAKGAGLWVRTFTLRNP